MIKPLQVELDELIHEYVPPLIDLDQLNRLVEQDEAPGLFDGECADHPECQNL